MTVRHRDSMEQVRVPLDQLEELHHFTNRLLKEPAMARLSEQEIALVRSRASIVDVISHYISLSKKGRNYVRPVPVSR